MSEPAKELIVKYSVTDASIEELREKYAVEVYEKKIPEDLGF